MAAWFSRAEGSEDNSFCPLSLKRREGLTRRFVFEGKQLAATEARVLNYRDRAGELRAVADGMKNHDAKAMLADIAGDYDNVAANLEDMRRKLEGATGSPLRQLSRI